MADLISMRSISGNLHLRGVHRFNGDPGLGVLGAFLLFVLVIRTASNLYLIQSITAGTAIIDTSQVTCAMLSYTALWGCLGGSMHLLRMLRIIPENAFTSFRPQGREFRRSFRRQILLKYPVNYISVFLLFSFPLLIPSEDKLYFLGQSLIILFSLMAVFVILERLPEGLVPEARDIQFFEVLFLLFVVLLNPDTGNIGGKVVIQSQGRFLPVGGHAALIVVPATVLLILAAFAILALFRKGERRVKNRQRLPVLVLWYFRVIGKVWLILYLIVLPLIYSSLTGDLLKRRLSAASLIFGFFSFVLFGGISNMEVDSLWNRSFFQAKHWRFWVPVFIAAVFSGSVPALFFLYAA